MIKSAGAAGETTANLLRLIPQSGAKTVGAQIRAKLNRMTTLLRSKLVSKSMLNSRY